MKHVKRGILYLLGAFWAVITLYPLFFTLISSFKNNNEIFSSDSALQLPSILRFENYYEAIVTGGMVRALLNSLLLAGMSTLLVVLLASMVSYTISRFRYKLSDVACIFFLLSITFLLAGKTIWFIIFCLASVGGFVISFYFRKLNNNFYHKFNNILYTLFLLGIMIPVYAILVPLNKTMVDIKGTDNLFVLALVYTAFRLPLSIMIVTAAMRGISRSMDEAALIDGCGPFRLYSHIILPLSVPALSTVGILTFLEVYNDLLFGVMFLNNPKLYTIPRAMQIFVGSKVTAFGPIFASIILAIGPMIAIYLLFQSKVERGLTAGATKE